MAHSQDIKWLYEQVEWMKEQTHELRKLYRQLAEKPLEFKIEKPRAYQVEAAQGSIKRIIDEIEFQKQDLGLNSYAIENMDCVLAVARKELKKWR